MRSSIRRARKCGINIPGAALAEAPRKYESGIAEIDIELSIKHANPTLNAEGKSLQLSHREEKSKKLQPTEQACFIVISHPESPPDFLCDIIFDINRKKKVIG